MTNVTLLTLSHTCSSMRSVLAQSLKKHFCEKEQSWNIVHIVMHPLWVSPWFLEKCYCFRNVIIADNHLNQGLNQFTLDPMRTLNTMKKSLLNFNRNRNAVINARPICLWYLNSLLIQLSGNVSQYANIMHIYDKMYLLIDRFHNI